MADLFDIVVARKLSGGGGGGGSSDFSTAEVTITSSKPVYGLSCFYINDEFEDEYLAFSGMTTDDASIYVVGGTPVTITAVLYKGSDQIVIAAADESIPIISVSGNATLDGEMVYITGDCTITIS